MWILFFAVFSQHFLTTFTATPVNSDIFGSVRWKLSASPYIIQDNDLVIASDALLHIEPGVKVYVGPGLTIKVKGTLRARGLPDRKIVFTRIPPDFLPLNETMSRSNPTTSFNQIANGIRQHRIRLVEGNELRQGQLQLWIADRWRPVCSRNTEWSKTDCRVACRQLGFADGNFTLGPMAKNRTASVEIVAPGCNGNESIGTDPSNSSWNGLFDCPGLQQNFTIGSTVCQLQDLVGLQCWGVNEYFYLGYWKGIEVHNATVTEIIIPPNWGGSHGNTRLNVSASVLEHVEILYAGVNRSMHQTAALSSSPYPPVLKYVRLANNAYDAVNFSYIRGPAILQDVTLENNGGHGAAISSLLGYLRFTRVTTRRNGGDGSHIRMISGELYHWPDEAPELVHRAQWPCRPGAIPASPVFPFLVVAELPGPTFRASGSCELQIESDQVMQVLTVTLLEALHDPLASGTVDIWDSSTNEQLAHWNLRNDSDPQSRVGVRVGRIYQGISSVKNKIRIQFSWEKPAEQAICSQLAGCVRAIMQVSVGQTTVPEVEILDSKFEENMHRGLTISNAWSYVRVVGSLFAYNQFDAGLKLINGSTDLFVHNCSFLQNERTGLNVSTTGGFRQINQSLFVHNRGHGLSVWNPQWPQNGRKPNGVIETHVHTSQFFANWWNGIQFYNSCLPMNLLVNLSKFEMNGANGIRVYSCLNGTMTAMTNFTVGYSNFKANRRAAIWVEPMTWMHGHVTNCTFTNHQYGTIRIDNSLDLVKAEIYRSFPVNYIIKNSEFTGNTGPSVIDIRLTELSELQHISLMYNKLIGNSIRMRSNLLNPRSSAPAVVAIGSSHIVVQRNHFWNPESDIELASHLSASDKRINATMNFWGSLSDWGLTEWGAIHEAVQGKLFDQNHRYTLARIDYHPVLKDPDLQSNFNTANEPPFVPEFIKTDQQSGQIQIGGRIAVERNRQIELTPLADQEAYYHVTKDILVPSGGILVVHPGVRLYFENGLGLFSQGELKLVGTEAMYIQMDLLDRKQTDTLGVFVLPNFTVSETETADELPDHLLAYGNRSIRLTGGQWEANMYLGRLELLASLENDEIPVQSTIHSKEAVWGTVCDHGFGLHAAMLSCSALGLVAHPKDWFVSRTVRDQIASNADRWANASQMPIHLANLDCQGHETELFQCRGDRALEHSCPHSADVVIRCHRPGWAGVHVTASDPGSRTPIRHVRITNAGLLDYTSTEFVPSLQLDYYSEIIVDLQITQGLSDGLQILFSHPLLGAAILDSRIANNFETGLLTRTSSLQVHRCRLEHNLLGAGLEYNPVMTPQDMFAFHSGFVQTLTLFSRMILTDSQRKTLPEGWQLITAREKLHPTGITFANIPSGHFHEKTIYRTELMADDPHRMHQIILHLLDFPVVNCPTSKDQAAVTPNATIGPMQLLPGLLPTSNVPCHTLRCLPLEGNTVEELIIFDGPMDSKDPDRLYSWHIPRDLIRLPLISAGSQLTIEFRIHGIRSGNLLFALETRDFQHTQQPRQFPGSGANAHYAAFQFEPDPRYSPIPNLVIQDTVVQQNAFGLRLYHYNDPLDGWDRLFWRHTAEVFTMSNVSLIENKVVAIHIPSVSRFAQDWYLPSYAENSQTTERLSFIAYRLENCLLTDNAEGSILAEHNHVEFANNVWSYHVSNCSFRRNGQGSMQADPVLTPSEMIVNPQPKGLVFQLPFVSTQFDWRYQPVTTHRLQFLKNEFRDNHQFTFVVDGYHAQVELTENTFENNVCQEILPDQGSVQQGLLHSKGMEKSLQMLTNRFVRNRDCQFILQLHGLSQAPTAETVTAHLARNIFKQNTCFSVRFNQSDLPNPGMCYTVGFFGTQNGTLRHNVFDNQKPYGEDLGLGMRYELIAGVHSVKVPNFVDARLNYWATSNATQIEERIFQFDNWNSFSIVRFDNFFLNEQLLNTATTEAQSVNRITDPIRTGILGGRLTSNLHLIYREEPYRVYSDLTVMPGCELSIDAGVKLQFAPHIGLLVLGRLVARGFRSQPIRFGPIPVQSNLPNRPSRDKSNEMRQVKSEHPRVVGSADATAHVVGRLGLTTPFVRLLGGERVDEGFVHFYNSTAQRWDVACDPQFSIEVAQVVCQELGQPTLNAIVRPSRLYDFQLYGFENPLVQKHVWMESYVCHGFETHRHQCVRRLNYDHVRCLRHQEFVFLRCAPLPSGPEFINSDLALYTWGNVRIVLNGDENDLIEVATNEKPRQSVLEYVLLERAGLLHGQRVAALTTVYAYPRLSFINITNCLGDGFELINPRGFIDISNTSVSGCLGRAISMTVLNGDSTDPTTYGLSSTQTLAIPTLPPQQGSLLPPPRPSPGQPVGTVAADLVRWPLEYYPFTGERHLLGLVPMCAGEKTIEIVDRLLVQYQYSWSGIHACTKIFRSIVPGRRLAWRFLAVRLYHDPFAKNTLELYNGANFNTSYLIAEVTANTLNNHNVPVGERFTFVTSSIHDILGVYLHTSPANSQFGFIAEVITLPISPERTYPELNKQMRHRVEVCEFQANQGGGIHIQSVGENGPDLYLADLRVMENGLQLLNLTGPPAIDIRVTNTFNLAITNSYFFRHSGNVIRARLYASQVTRGARMNITNNAIVRNRFGGALLIEGNHFNTLQVIRNYIAHNDCGQRDLVRIAGVLARPFAYNFIHDNRGAVLLNCSGEEQLSQGSRFEFNGFYKNEALNYTRRTTVFSDNSKNQFRDNYFKNNANSYELVVGNRSIIRTLPIQPGTNCPLADETCPHGWTLRLEFDACLCYRPDSLDARLNWWGDTVSATSDHRKIDSVSKADGSRGSVAEIRAQSFARSRIYDEDDDPYLIRVDYTMAYVDNSSVLGPGIHCPPTWEFNEFNCFYYFGIPMSYNEAHEFCLTEVGAILATSRSRIAWLTDQMSRWQHNYAWINRYTWVSRAWIYSEVPLLSQCPTTRNGWLEPYECEKNIPFFCQKAPYGVYAGVQPAVVVCIGFIGAAVLIAVVSLLVLSLVKSRRRQAQRILSRRERQKWLIGLHGRQSWMVAGSRFVPSRNGSSVDLSDLAGGSVGQLTPHRLYLSKETLEPATYSHIRQGSHAAIGSVTTTHGYPSNGSNVSVSLSKYNPYQWWEHDYSEPRPPSLVGAGIEPQDLNVGQSLLGVSVALHNGAGNRIVKPQRRPRRTAPDSGIRSSLRATSRIDESNQHKDNHSTFGKHPQSSYNSLTSEPYQEQVQYDRYNSYGAELNYADQPAEVHRGRRAYVERSVVPIQSTTGLRSFSTLKSKKHGQQVPIVRPNNRPRPTSGQQTSLQNDSDSDHWDDEF